MNSSCEQRNRPAWRLKAICFIYAALITGCGQTTTAGVGTGGTGSVAKTVSGTVADGYLAFATVFLDKNNNDQLDENEVPTQTDENGSFTLSIDSADIGNYPIVAHAIAGTTYDTDNNPDKVKLTSSYLLSLPKESVTVAGGGNFISPISTWIHKTMAANPGRTLDEAENQLRVNMRMPNEMDMLADYINLGSTTSTDPNKNNYEIMHTVAQNMVLLLAQEQNLQNISTETWGMMRTRMR